MVIVLYGTADSVDVLQVGKRQSMLLITVE
jgi:hypothetical protein